MTQIVTQIAFLFYEDMTALDAVGPYEILARLPGADVKFVASTPGPINTDVGLVLTADSALEDVDARAIQLLIEYDPEPPFDSGSLARTNSDTKRRAQELFLPRTELSSVG